MNWLVSLKETNWLSEYAWENVKYMYTSPPTSLTIKSNQPRAGRWSSQPVCYQISLGGGAMGAYATPSEVTSSIQEEKRFRPYFEKYVF